MPVSYLSMRKLLPQLLALLGLLALYSWWVEPMRLCLTPQDVSDSDRPLANPIRILLLTDWHLSRFTRPHVLRAKVARLLRLHRKQPFDLLLLGGDFIDDDPRLLTQLGQAVGGLKPFGIPTFAVLGNHDYTSFGGDVAPLITCLQAQGVTVLRNEAAVVTLGSQRLLIVGLDDLQEAETYHHLDQYQSPAQYQKAAEGLDWYARFDGIEPNTPRLLLTHNPDAVYLPGRKPLAVLAGHTHGGQIMLLDWISRPLHRWIHPALPPGSLVTWAGRQTVGGRELIVSRGIEGAALPFRLMRSPEAVLITLR